jgi:hypothetical protein
MAVKFSEFAIGTIDADLELVGFDSATPLNVKVSYSDIKNDITLILTNRRTASYTLALTDQGKLVDMNVATANNLTVPLDSAVAFPIGAQIDISQYGAGQTTVVATGGVTVRSAAGALKLAAQYSGATLVKIGTDEWYLFGDITV